MLKEYIPSLPHDIRYSRNEANLEHILVVRRKGKLSLIAELPDDELLPLDLCDHHRLTTVQEPLRYHILQSREVPREYPHADICRKLTFYKFSLSQRTPISP